LVDEPLVNEYFENDNRNQEIDLLSLVVFPLIVRRLFKPDLVSVGMTVADMDRSVDFYTNVLSFQKVSDVEVLGTEYEQLQGLFGVRLRVVKLQLGNEQVELTEYLTPTDSH
jgi:hypothetical protein